MTSADGEVYGTIRSSGTLTFNHADAIQGAQDIALITAITVYTSKARVSRQEGEEDIIVDVSFEYSVGGKIRESGPFHPAASQALSSTFGLPGGNHIIEVVGAFSPRGLTFICFKTNKRTHMYGQAVASSKGGSSFAVVVPADKRLLGFRGQVGRCDEEGEGQDEPIVGIQNLAPIFGNLPYLANAQVSTLTMGLSEEANAKERAMPRRKLMRVSGRSANSSEVSSVGSPQSMQDSGKPQRSSRSERPHGKSSRSRSRSKNTFVTVTRTWKHPLGHEIEGEFVGDSINGRATFTWPSGDRYVGQVQDGVAHGWGVLTVAKTGDTYNGSFEAGKLTLLVQKDLIY
jgi:hypothetical protein